MSAAAGGAQRSGLGLPGTAHDGGSPSALFRRAMRLYGQLGIVDSLLLSDRQRIERLAPLFKLYRRYDARLDSAKVSSGKGTLNKLRRGQSGRDPHFMRPEGARDFVYRMTGQLPGEGTEADCWYPCETGEIYARLVPQPTRDRLRSFRADSQRGELLRRFEEAWVLFLCGQPPEDGAEPPSLPWQEVQDDLVPSTLEDLGVFIGRDSDLSALEASFGNPGAGARLIVFGEPGVGKTHLANEYGRRHHARYPGGTFFVPFDADPAESFARLVSVTNEPVQERARRALRGLRRPTLLIFDDVASEQSLREWLPPPVLPVHLLVTSTSCDWSTDHRTHRLDRLPAKDALALVEHVAGKSICDDYGSALLHRTGGLPTYLKPAARHVRYEVSRRRVPDLGSEDRPEADAGLLRALQRLSTDTRLWLRTAALFNPTQVPQQALDQLLEAEGWHVRRRQLALDGALDRLLVSETREGLRMHGLVADFLRRNETAELPEPLKRRHWQTFLSLARDFGRTPGDGELRSKLYRYPPQLVLWLTLTESPGWNDLWSVGLAIIETGRYEAASEWFAHALATAERELGTGLASHADIARCLHYLGMCDWALKDYSRALPSFERAASESLQGNREGRVDHARVAGNLHQQAYCLEELGRLDEALSCFRRSIEQTRRGTLLGEVDEANVGKGLHHVGCCQRRLGRLDDACETLRLAVDAKSKGHADGRVDHDSIGRSLHELGECWFALDDIERARASFASAIEAKRHGDGHCRIDQDHIGLSLHRLADCLARIGDLQAALATYEAALASRRIGDVHGAIDQEGIGNSLHAIGDCWSALGDPQRARSSQEDALQLRPLTDPRLRAELRSDSEPTRNAGR